MVTMAQGGQGARLRAAVDRMHAAQLAALAVMTLPGPPGPPGAAGTEAPEMPEGKPVAGWDVYGAERQLLAQVAEMGSLLVRLGLLAQADGEAVEVRRRLVTLAVACGNTLAELVTLAFEVAVRDGPGETGESHRHGCEGCRADAQAAAGHLASPEA